MTKEEEQDSLRNYQFIKTIGEGTFGKVKLSIHLLTNENVAIKILEKSRITDKEELERVEKEINYLKLFNHPNIIQVYEVIENVHNFYIVMEYVPGGELFNYIVEKERIDEKEASFFYSQIIHGIKEISKKNICHRDIKPENLLLTKEKTIKIIDFGLSNEYKDTLDTQCGSPCYAAPEIIRGIKYNGLMVDIWASGIILFAMIFGYLPFDDKNNNILFKKIIECNLEFPDDIEASKEVKDLIAKILTKNPGNRIKLDEILKHPFLVEGNKLYHKMIKPPLRFNQDKLIIDYMINVLNYSNVDNSIIKLVKANKHNGCTTTYKLLKKQILENRFDYKLYEQKMRHIIPYISPVRNINVKLKNLNEKKNVKDNIKYINIKILNNKKKIKINLRKSLFENNKNKINKAHSTDNTKIADRTKDLSIDKKKNVINNNDILDLQRFNNHNYLIIKNFKINPLINKIISQKNNKNNFKKKIDTSISVDTKKPKIKNNVKKPLSKTPPKYLINPFIYETDTYKYNYKRKKIMYFPYLIYHYRGKSDDKINKTIKYKYLHNPINLNINSQNKNRYMLTPINYNKYIRNNGLSTERPNYMKYKGIKNNVRFNRYMLSTESNIKKNEKKYLIRKNILNNLNNINKNINFYNSKKREKSPCLNKNSILDNNVYNNIIAKKISNEIKRENIIDTPKPINKNNYICYKYNTIQTTPNKSKNSIYINTNIICNCHINNGNNKNNKNNIGKEKEKNKIKRILHYEKYTPLNLRNKCQIKEIKDLSERFKTLSTTDGSSIYHQKINFPKKELKKFFIGNKNINPGIKEYKSKYHQ